MAGPTVENEVSMEAAEDLSAAQYAVVVFSGTDWTVQLPAAAAAGDIAGVLINDPEEGEAAGVQIGGVAWVYAAATIAAGDQLEIANAAGAVRPITSQSHATPGYSMEDAASGDKMRMKVCPIQLQDIHPTS